MANTWATKAVTVTGLEAAGEDFADAELIEISHPYGEQWGTCLLNFPRARAQTGAALRGQLIGVQYDGRLVFAGHIIEAPRAVGEVEDGIVATAADFRWLLSKRIIGQYGAGEVETVGGWALMGFRPHFNPEGRRNRGKTKSGASYLFSDAADAAAWTAKDILEFVLRFFASNLEADLDALPDAWDQEISDFYPYGKSVGAVLSLLAAQVGNSWSIRYVDTDVHFVAIGAGATATSTVTLPTAEAAGKASDATEWAARRVYVTDRITDSVDRVEVHSARTRVDMTLTTAADADCVQCLEYFAPEVPGFVAAYVLDPTGEGMTAAATALELPAGSRPVRWHRELGTITTPDGSDYAAAGDDSLKAGIGQPVMAEHCVWLSFDESGWQLVKSGIRIDPINMIVYIGDTLQFMDGSSLEDLAAGDFFDVWISAAVEWTHNAILYTNPASYLLSSGNILTEIVTRSDIVPRYQYRLILPDKAAATTNPNAQVTIGSEEVVAYLPQLEVMTALYQALQGIRKREVTVRADLLDIPDIVPGNKLAIAPADLDLTGEEVITHYSAEFRETSRVTLYATNNLARLQTGDLPT